MERLPAPCAVTHAGPAGGYILKHLLPIAANLALSDPHFRAYHVSQWIGPHLHE